jgi:hypothetical protein
MRCIDFRRLRFLLITVAAGTAMLVVAATAVYFRRPRFDTARVPASANPLMLS